MMQMMFILGMLLGVKVDVPVVISVLRRQREVHTQPVLSSWGGLTGWGKQGSVEASSRLRVRVGTLSLQFLVVVHVLLACKGAQISEVLVEEVRILQSKRGRHCINLTIE